jgi:hypothetical protein
LALVLLLKVEPLIPFSISLKLPVIPSLSAGERGQN